MTWYCILQEVPIVGRDVTIQQLYRSSQHARLNMYILPTVETAFPSFDYFKPLRSRELNKKRRDTVKEKKKSLVLRDHETTPLCPPDRCLSTDPSHVQRSIKIKCLFVLQSLTQNLSIHKHLQFNGNVYYTDMFNIHLLPVDVLLDSRFARSKPAEDDGVLREIKSVARLSSEGK
jgi:hypothetical protein